MVSCAVCCANFCDQIIREVVHFLCSFCMGSCEVCCALFCGQMIREVVHFLCFFVDEVVEYKLNCFFFFSLCKNDQGSCAL